MSTKNSRTGKKYCGTHTTLIPAAVKICDIANGSVYVDKISAGFIVSGLKPIRGNKRLKITDRKSSLLVSVRDNCSRQEISIFVNNAELAKEALEQSAKKLGFDVCKIK